MKYPILSTTFIETEDGFIARHDYGKYGFAEDRVIYEKATPEQVAANRRALNTVLKKFGYRLVEDEKKEGSTDAG